MRLLVLPLAAVSIGSGGAPAAAQQYPVAPVLTLTASAHGVPTGVVLPGERWRLRGTLTPAARGDRVTISFDRGGAQVLATRLTVRAGTGVGRFSKAVHSFGPGRLTVTAVFSGPARADVTSPPVTIDVLPAGRRRPGCAFAPHVTRVVGARRARVSGRTLWRGVRLATGARIDVPRGDVLRLEFRHASYVEHRGHDTVGCQALRVDRGRVVVRATRGAGRVLARSVLASMRGDGRMLATPGTISYRGTTGTVTSPRTPTAPLRAIDGDDVLIDAAGLPRLTTWPFARLPQQRPPRRSDRLPAFWADGSSCSTGCRPPGARTGWPLKPFHQQHALRSGMNEIRPANLHIGFDIQASYRDRVYALQAGTAHIASRGTSDIHVDVGDYEYWHISPAVGEGSHVGRGQLIGRIIFAARHLHLSEVRGGIYLNPLRPGGRVLKPWVDSEPPIIGRPRRANGTVYAEVFDPQSFRISLGYRTPVLAPAAVAWRARDSSGRAITPLEFAYRGSQHYPKSAQNAVYGPGSHPPASPSGTLVSWLCYDRVFVCVPKWNYRLPGVPPGASAITVYAWDWHGNEAALDSALPR